MYQDKLMNLCFLGCLLITWAFPKMETKRGERFQLFIDICVILLTCILVWYNIQRTF